MNKHTSELTRVLGCVRTMEWILTRVNSLWYGNLAPVSVRATLHPDAPAALELSIARTRVLDYL